MRGARPKAENHRQHLFALLPGGCSRGTRICDCCWCLARGRIGLGHQNRQSCQPGSPDARTTTIWAALMDGSASPVFSMRVFRFGGVGRRPTQAVPSFRKARGISRPSAEAGPFALLLFRGIRRMTTTFHVVRYRGRTVENFRGPNGWWHFLRGADAYSRVGQFSRRATEFVRLMRIRRGLKNHVPGGLRRGAPSY